MISGAPCAKTKEKNMRIEINLNYETLELLHKRSKLLEVIQHERNPSGDVHPRSQEFNELTALIQMHLGRLALEQVII